MWDRKTERNRERQRIMAAFTTNNNLTKGSYPSCRVKTLIAKKIKAIEESFQYLWQREELELWGKYIGKIEEGLEWKKSVPRAINYFGGFARKSNLFLMFHYHDRIPFGSNFKILFSFSFLFWFHWKNIFSSHERSKN